MAFQLNGTFGMEELLLVYVFLKIWKYTNVLNSDNQKHALYRPHYKI